MDSPASVPPSEIVWLRNEALSARKQFFHGTHRTAPPEQTLARIRPHARAVGLTRLADITGLDRIGIPTVLAHRPNSPTLANAAGKGYTREAATVSAAMEATEIYHAENLRLELLHCSHEELARTRAILPLELLPLTRHSLFRPTHPEYWVAGWDLLTQTEVLVPVLSVGMSPPPQQRPLRWMPFTMGTNGLAGGNHMLESLCAALYEVAERDALACQKLANTSSRYQVPRVRLESIRDPLVRDLLARLSAASVKPILLDCTVDTDIPCYMATIYDTQVRHLGVYTGYGAHLDPAIAMVRALTEAAQARLVYIAGSRDDFFRRDKASNEFIDNPARIAAMESNPEVVDAGARPSSATDSFGGDANALLARFRRVGVPHVIAVDLSHSEIGIPVIRVIVPGLEGYMFEHYSPGPRAVAFSARVAVAG